MSQDKVKSESARILFLVQGILESDLDMPLDTINWKAKRKRLATLFISEMIKSGCGDFDFLVKVRDEIRLT